MIPIFKPCCGEDELEALREPLVSGWMGLGPKTKEFEDRFAEFIGVKRAVGLNSATAALHLALNVCKLQNMEVITTPMTFVSTNHAILYNAGIPVFADIESDTLNIDVNDVERKITDKTKAVLVVHYGGHACDMDRLLELTRARDIFVIEDCAHGCGGKYKGRKLGSIGHFGCFSFHAVKNLATGDGGMVTTDDDEAADRLQKLRWMGITRGTWDRSEREGYSWEYDVSELGFKCHMNDITASIGLVQLKKLGRNNARRRLLAERYGVLLSGADWIETPVTKNYAESAWHNYVIKVREPGDRDDLMRHLQSRGISTGMHYIPNHLYEMYRPYIDAPLPVAETVWKRLITLPLFPDLTEDDQDRIVREILSFKK